MSDPDATAHESLAERTAVSGPKLWLLLDANRYLVAAVVLAATFLALVGLSQLAPTRLEPAMRGGDPVETTFQGFLGAIITGVTLVVTINQLVLSQELGPLGDQRQRMQGAMSFLDDLEDVVQEPVAPAEPAALLGSILDAVAESADALAASVGTDAPASGDDRIGRYAEAVVAEAERSADRIGDAEFGTFGVLAAALTFDYGRWLHEGRALRGRDDGERSEVATAAFEELLGALRFYAPAREHVKTLYFQWELINLSRDILYAAVPALVVSVAMILFAGDPAVVTGPVAGVPGRVWLVAGAVTVAMVPFVLLLSYILRIGTVAKRTLAVGPVTLRRTGDGGADDGGTDDAGR